jgi:hypothetical protein
METKRASSMIVGALAFHRDQAELLLIKSMLLPSF